MVMASKPFSITNGQSSVRVDQEEKYYFVSSKNPRVKYDKEDGWKEDETSKIRLILKRYK
jgi:hypothetical protein